MGNQESKQVAVWRAIGQGGRGQARKSRYEKAQPKGWALEFGSLDRT